MVFVGGAVGVLLSTMMRYALAPFISTPLALALVNVLGAFALGLLVGRIPEGTENLRVVLGTGFLGGFTSFSAIAVTVFPIQQILLRGLGNDPSQAWSYQGLLKFELPLYSIPLAIVSLLAGMCAAWIGLRLATPSASKNHTARGGQRLTDSDRPGQQQDLYGVRNSNDGEGHRGI